MNALYYLWIYLGSVVALVAVIMYLDRDYLKERLDMACKPKKSPKPPKK